jgi:hypothetical protein
MTPRLEPRPNPDRAPPPRATETGIGRPGGLLCTAVTAATVFALGFRLLPQRRAATGETAPVAPPTAPANQARPIDAAPADASGAAPSLADGFVDGARDSRPAAGPDAARTVDAASDGSEPSDGSPASPDTDASSRAAGKASASPAKDRRLGAAKDIKDVARDAWRRNAPDVSVAAGRSTIVIPIKGSPAGATFHVSNKPRAVLVKLPRAASLITMRVYRLDRAGFRQVWINQAETNARPKDGSSIKIVLGHAVDPEVEIRDDYLRVTIPRP